MRRDPGAVIHETSAEIRDANDEINVSGRKKNGLGSLNNKG